MKSDLVRSSLERMACTLHQDFPDIEKLLPGEKAMFIRRNLDLILQFNQVFGDDKTIEIFHLTSNTLYSIKNNDGKYVKHMPANTAKLKASMAIDLCLNIEKRLDHLTVRTEDITSLRREVRELKAEFGRFAEITAESVTKALIAPLLQGLTSQYQTKYMEDGETVDGKDITMPVM